MLCAHLDTVHEDLPSVIYTDIEQKIMWSPFGLGADDRAGVYGILSLITNRKNHPTILFTADEEVGCLGVRDFLENYPKAPIDLKMIIQLDRQGHDESVYYLCDNKEFEEWINSFGFQTAVGTYTDISYLCPKWNIAGVNLSVGYYLEHTKLEFLNYNELQDTIAKIDEILCNHSKTDNFIYIRKSSSYVPGEGILKLLDLYKKI